MAVAFIFNTLIKPFSDVVVYELKGRSGRDDSKYSWVVTSFGASKVRVPMRFTWLSGINPVEKKWLGLNSGEPIETIICPGIISRRTPGERRATVPSCWNRTLSSLLVFTHETKKQKNHRLIWAEGSFQASHGGIAIRFGRRLLHGPRTEQTARQTGVTSRQRSGRRWSSCGFSRDQGFVYWPYLKLSRRPSAKRTSLDRRRRTAVIKKLLSMKRTVFRPDRATMNTNNGNNIGGFYRCKSH